MSNSNLYHAAAGVITVRRDDNMNADPITNRKPNLRDSHAPGIPLTIYP